MKRRLGLTLPMPAGQNLLLQRSRFPQLQQGLCDGFQRCYPTLELRPEELQIEPEINHWSLLELIGGRPGV
jgi:hypothetical protein